MIAFERWDEIKPLVQGALDLPDDEREAYLDEACQGDQELRRSAEALLAVPATRADAFDDFVVMPPGVHSVTLKEGDEIGPYRIVRTLGTGGMSAVYLANDPRHERQVALKVLAAPRRQRQLHEERMAARFHHPNIATFYDSGQVEAGPAYFAMEYVDGEPITNYCDARDLGIDERLRLLLTVCDAVSYAHRNLVVHRDIKPANILVTNEGVPKLLDFGIAKKLSPSLSAQAESAPEERSMTIAFASPEQLAGETTTTSTDIYSLGVLLSLVLTGRLPYPVRSYHDLPWAVRNMEPERPSQLVLKQARRDEDDTALLPLNASAPRRTSKLARLLKGDLDAIVLRALRKEPERRYHTVAAMAEDIRRHLAILPVSAHPASARYRIGKFLRRRAGSLFVTGVVMAIILTMSGLLVRQYRRAIRGEREASVQAERTRHVNRFVVDLFRRTSPYNQGSPSETSLDELLDQSSRTIEGGLAAYPDIKASLLSVLGEIYTDREGDARGRALIETALALQRKGPRDLALAETLQRYGMVLTSQGHYKESDASLLEAKGVLASIREKRDPVLEARILTAQAANRVQQGEYETARKLLEESIVTLRQAPGSFSELATSLLGLGTLLEQKDRDAEAEALYRQALSYAERMHEPRNPHVAELSNSLGVLLYKRGDYAGAKTMYLRALDIKRATIGENHRSYALTLVNLAALESKEGQYTEALKSLTQAVAILQKLLPKNHERVLTARNQMASTLVQLRQYESAEKEFLEVLALERASLPKDSPTLATTLNNLAYLYQDEGRLEESRALYEEALGIFTKLIGRKSRAVATLHANLGSIDRARGDNQSAEGNYKEALDISRGIAGGKTPDTVTALTNLASFYIAAGRLEEASDLVREASALAESVVGPANWLTGSAYSVEAKLLLAQGDVRGALSRIQKARGILVAALPEHDWRISVTDSVLGAALGKSGKETQAEGLLLSSLAELRRIKGAQSLQAREAMERVRSFYEDLGRSEQAAQYRSKRPPR